MCVALCSAFLNGDLWEIRLKKLFGGNISIDEYNDPRQLFCCADAYSAVIVAMNGAEGMNAVKLVRHGSSKIPIIWISDTERYGFAAYEYSVSAFLPDTADDNRLFSAISKHLLQTNGPDI